MDTAASGCSVALWSGKLVAERAETMPRGQSERLLPLIDELLAGAAIEYCDLDLLAVTIGPGAFTGLRICISAAKGLGLALNRPVVGVNTFDAVAARVPLEVQGERNLAIVLESKRDDFYFQLINSSGELLHVPTCIDGTDLALCLEDCQPVLLVGDGKERATSFLSDKVGPGAPDIKLYQGDDRVRAADVAKIVASRGNYETTNIAPLYLRPPDVTLSKTKLG